MISQRDYLSNRDQHAGRAYHMGQRLCSTCHVRATRLGTLPFPAPPSAKQPTNLTELWWLARSDARREMKAVGFAPLSK
jgi:hypothetical protein